MFKSSRANLLKLHMCAFDFLVSRSQNLSFDRPFGLYIGEPGRNPIEAEAMVGIGKLKEKS